MTQDYKKHEGEEYFNMYKDDIKNFDKYAEKLLNKSRGIGYILAS